MMNTNPTIAIDDPTRADVLALLERHYAFTLAHSPEGACYTFKPEELAGPAMTFWTARRDGRPVGCVALYQRDERFGELKSLHVAEGERGTGLGERLVQVVIDAARVCGFEELGLETGKSDGFAASRRLYARLGFSDTPAFPPYQCGGFSHCMKRAV
ncbi:GNAT family N-acetyltransferase [Maricaulaceae bacterium NA33B04]|nr:GNAT family N-acetyltransferase [Maricaulaceae bacterium NA33B04]